MGAKLSVQKDEIPEERTFIVTGANTGNLITNHDVLLLSLLQMMWPRSSLKHLSAWYHSTQPKETTASPPPSSCHALKRSDFF